MINQTGTLRATWRPVLWGKYPVFMQIMIFNSAPPKSTRFPPPPPQRKMETLQEAPTLYCNTRCRYVHHVCC